MLRPFKAAAVALALLSLLPLSAHAGSKPAAGTTVNTSNSDASGLVAAWGLLEGSTTSSADSTGNGHTLTLSSSGLWGTNGSGDPILHITTGVATPAAVTSPISFTNAQSWTIAFRAKTAASSGQLGMVAGDNTNTTDFVWLNPASTFVRIRDHGNNDFDSTVSAANLSTAADYLIVRDASAGTVTSYRNGTLVNSISTWSSASRGAITFNTLGNGYTGTTFALVGDIEYFYIWNVAKSSTTAANLAANPYAFFGSGALTAGTVSTSGVTATSVTISGTACTGGTATYTYQFQRSPDNGSNAPTGVWSNVGSAQSGVAAGVSPSNVTDTGLSPSTKYWYRYSVTDSAGSPATATATPVSVTTSAQTLSVTPSAIPANHAGTITLTLTGSGTNWVSGTTTFSLSGVSGVVKVSQSIASTTSATVVVTTGSGTGTLTVSDGSVSGTTAVGVASFTLSPSAGATGATQTVTANGTNTVWTQETASTLFGLSGGTGASLSSIAVTSNTSATFSLVNGTAAGTLTVTATPTGATQTFSVTANTGTITVTTPKPYATFQRNGSNQATVSVVGTYTYSGGTVPAITASLAGSTPTTLIPTPSGGAFTGTVTFTVTPGTANVQGNLTIAFSDGAASTSVAFVGVGDNFLIAGQSNAEGRLSAAQSYSPPAGQPGLKATLFKQGSSAGTWAELLDPTDPQTATGSFWPIVATMHMADQGVPCGIITAADGSTGLVNTPDWLKGGLNGSGGTEYTQALTQVNNSQANAVKAVLWWQGEQDSNTSVPRGQYLGRFLDLAWNLAGDVTGSPKLLPVQIGYGTGAPDAIRAATTDAMRVGGNVTDGPGVYDLSNATHPGSGGASGTAATFAVPIAGRIWAAMKADLLGGSNVGHGPRLTSIQFDPTHTKLTVTFDQPLKTGLTFGSALWSVSGNGSPATVSSVAYAPDPNAVLVTLASAATPPVTVSYAQGLTTASQGQAVLGADFALPASLGTVQLPAEPFAGVTAAAQGTQGSAGVFFPVNGGPVR